MESSESEHSGLSEPIAENTFKSFEKSQVRVQQMRYFSNLFPNVYEQVYLNVLSITDQNYGLWPKENCYCPTYVDGIDKTDFHPITPIDVSHSLYSILPDTVETIQEKIPKIESILTLILKKMEQLYEYLCQLRKELIPSFMHCRYVFKYRHLDAADTLYCFLLVCGYTPSNLLVHHVSRHVKVADMMEYDPYGLIYHLTEVLMEEKAIDIQLESMIPYMVNCLLINDICSTQVDKHERKQSFLVKKPLNEFESQYYIHL